ncbi:glycine dehydrogenase, partial [Candidatus Bathyarchaeota archaeon]|nr:glycine dehydrogenase [Candidatus Bathyarchaeota archaeon]
LRAAVYLASLGSTGLEQLATINYKKANHLRTALSRIDGWSLVNMHPVFNEFVLHGTQDQVRNVIDSCNQKGILGPLDLGAFNQDWEGMVSMCVTEMNDLDSMNALIDIFSGASSP